MSVIRTIRHGGLAIDLPGDWEDRSSLLFVSPAPVDSRPTHRPIETSREAVRIDFTFDDRPPQEILKDNAGALREVDPSFELLADGPFACGLGEGWSFVQRLTLGDVVVRQISVAVTVGPIAITATGAASDGRFEHVRSKLEDVLRSIRSAGKQ